MRNKGSWIISGILVVMLIGASVFVVTQRKDLIANVTGQSEAETEINPNIVDWVSPPKSGEFTQPDGMGVERQITNIDSSSSGMANISLSGGSGKSPLMLATDDANVIAAAEQLVEVVDKGKYRCMIDWSEYEISESDYYVLLSLMGRMYEDELNKDSNNYTVIISQPTNEQLDAADIPVLFDISVDGYLTMYCNVITQNKASGTEVEEIKAFTVYYDGDILTFKE